MKPRHLAFVIAVIWSFIVGYLVAPRTIQIDQRHLSQTLVQEHHEETPAERQARLQQEDFRRVMDQINNAVGGQ